MNNNKKDHYKSLLEQNKKENEEIIKNIYNEDLTENVRESVGELSSFDNHPADIATEVFMAEHALGLKTMHQKSTTKIEEALQRIENGQYGMCDKCHEKIDEERLEIVPETKLCIDCAREKDKDVHYTRVALRDRPLGYDEVSTPFGTRPVQDKLSMNDDGKDIFEDLMKFGSAQSPSEEGNYKDFNQFFNEKMSTDGIVDEMDKYAYEDYQRQLPG